MVAEDGASSGGSPEVKKGGRPPVVHHQTGVVDLEATGGVAGRNVEQRGAPTPLLPLGRRTMQETEVRTPPRREVYGQGGCWASEF